VFKFIFRVIGLWLIAAAIVALVVDGTKSIAASKLVITPLGFTLDWMAHDLLIGLKSVIQNHIHPTLWDPVLQTVLLWPTWAVVAVLGLIFYLIGRRRKARKRLG